MTQLRLSTSCVTILGNIIWQRINLHVRIQSSKSNILASISFWTSIFKEKQCSMSWPGAPWWKAHERSGWYQTGNSLGTRGGFLVWTRFFMSKMESSSAYVIGIGLNCIFGACCRGCCWCWRSGLCWNYGWFREATRVLSLSNSAWSVCYHFKNARGFLVQTDTFCLHECCRCELTMDEDS